MNNLFSKALMITVGLGLLAPAPAHAFLSPKQKYKIRMEKKERRELADHKYVYYNRALSGIAGSLSLAGCFICEAIQATKHLSPDDAFLLSLAGNVLAWMGISCFITCFISAPAFVINEYGIRTRDNGLVIWEEITVGSIVPGTLDIVLALHDGTIITLRCGLVRGFLTKTLETMECFRKITFTTPETFFIEPKKGHLYVT